MTALRSKFALAARLPVVITALALLLGIAALAVSTGLAVSHQSRPVSADDNNKGTYYTN